MQPGDTLTLTIEKAVAGGRMLARHEGRVILVWGAIPGERVRASIDRIVKQTAYASTMEVLDASPDRRQVPGDWRCGGNVYAHVARHRQLALKSDVLVDALSRIGHVSLGVPPPIVGSPEAGYRMRARLHVRGGRVGFFREETHEICDAAVSGQLLPETTTWLARLQDQIAVSRLDVDSVEVSENMPATERACHLELTRPPAPGALDVILSDDAFTRSHVTDEIHLTDDEPRQTLRLRRHVRAFFQGNRYLLEPFARHVASLVPDGPVVDLYAGGGLFGLSVAARGGDTITLVEGDRISGSDLEDNASAFAGRVLVRRTAVESFLRSSARTLAPEATCIVDPPRTGMTKDVVAALIAWKPARIVFVSCDPATLARDSRILLDAGYELRALQGFDLFPNTAHIEAVALLERPAS